MSRVGDFLWSLAIKKGLTTAVVAFLSSYAGKLSEAGITVDQQALIAFLAGLLGMLRNWLKVQHGVRWL